jgi:hypothetical protein
LTPEVHGLARFVANASKTTIRPSPLIAGRWLSSFP